MKTRKILWMLTAILFCGVAAMFTSCTNEDNPVDPVDNLSEKIIGKWMTADVNGQPAPSNMKMVFTILVNSYAGGHLKDNDFRQKEMLNAVAKRISSYSRKKDYLSTQKEKAAIFRKMHHNPVLRILYKISKRLHLTV